MTWRFPSTFKTFDSLSKAVRLVKLDFLFVCPCLVLLITFLSFMYMEMVSQITYLSPSQVSVWGQLAWSSLDPLSRPFWRQEWSLLSCSPQEPPMITKVFQRQFRVAWQWHWPTCSALAISHAIWSHRYVCIQFVQMFPNLVFHHWG